MNYTDVGQSYEQSDDSDHDGIDDSLDNCPYAANPDQADSDGDGVGNVCDNCADTANPDQKANTCGDIWSAATAGPSRPAPASNNVGMVIGAACDLESARASAAGKSVTVNITLGRAAPPTTPILDPGSGARAEQRLGEVDCAVP